ncbi:MAG: ABC transporter permease, partial [Candidatus Kapaibacterium sp.]
MMRGGKILGALRNSAPFAWLRAEEELEEEFHFHIAMRIEENLRIGMSPAAAEQDAFFRFGDQEKLRNACLEARRENLWYVTFHLLRTSLIIALGLGSTLALLFLVDRAMVQPLAAYSNPDRLVLILGEQEVIGKEHVGVSPLDFKDWSARSTSFSDMGLYYYQQLPTGEIERPIVAMRGSEGYFRIAKPRPWIGRTFSADDFLSSASPSVLLTYDFWKDVYGGESSVLGSTIEVDGCSRIVLGVTDPDFQPYAKTDVLLPLPVDIVPKNPAARGNRFAFVLAELLPGISLQQAQSELNLITADLAARYPATNEGYRWEIESLQQAYIAPLEKGFFVLLGSVASLLLIALISTARRLLPMSRQQV